MRLVATILDNVDLERSHWQVLPGNTGIHCLCTIYTGCFLFYFWLSQIPFIDSLGISVCQ